MTALAPWSLKRESLPRDLIDRLTKDLEDQDKSGEPRVRCPLCAWEPGPVSRWTCVPVEHPEYFKGGCGTNWNTFATGGVCPGCQYKWQYTACLQCAGWSRHEDWYATEDEDS
jgi:hypothetical protein